MQERERIQEEFCQAKLQVVVATVAFGMGLDAMHVRCIIHLSMPRSLEEYVQQVHIPAFPPAGIQNHVQGIREQPQFLIENTPKFRCSLRQRIGYLRETAGWCGVVTAEEQRLMGSMSQVGRAGRSGEEGRCHLFLSNPDYLRLRSLSHSDGVDSCQATSSFLAIFTSHPIKTPHVGGQISPGNVR